MHNSLFAPGNDLDDDGLHGIAEKVLGIPSELGRGVGAGYEAVVAKDADEADLGLQEGKPHPQAGTGTLAESQEGVRTSRSSEERISFVFGLGSSYFHYNPLVFLAEVLRVECQRIWVNVGIPVNSLCRNVHLVSCL